MPMIALRLRIRERSMRVGAWCCVILLALLLVGAGQSQADEMPKSKREFTEFIAEIFRTQMPDAEVTVTGPLQLELKVPGGDNAPTDLQRVYDLCRKNEARCEDDIVDFAADVVENYREQNAPMKREDLRIVVRPSAYIAAINRSGKKPIAVPLAGDLWALVVFDRPASIRTAGEADIDRLKLSAKDAYFEAFANTWWRLHASAESQLAKYPRRGLLGGDGYVASLFAMHDVWAKAAQADHGNLLVAVPASDAILYTDGAAHDALPSIVETAHNVMSRDDKPFSDAVYRWTAQGWQLASPPSQKAQ